MINLELVNENEPIDLNVKKNTSGGVNDVQVNGTSIVKDGVADIPKATKDVAGVVKVETNTNRPVYIDSDGLLQIARVAGSDLDNRNQQKLISGAMYDHAVRKAMCDGKGQAWTDEEKASARERIGLEWKYIDTIEVSDVAQADITFPQNYSEFMVIADVQGSGTSIIYPQMAYFNADGELLDRSSQHSDFYPSDKAEHYELLFEKMNVESDTYFRMSGFEKTDFVFPKLKQNIQTTGWQQWYDATNAYQCHMWYGVKFSRTITSATFKLYAR